MNKYIKFVITGDLQSGKSTYINKCIEYCQSKNISYGGLRSFSVDEGKKHNIYIIPTSYNYVIRKCKSKDKLITCNYPLSKINCVGDRNTKSFNKEIFDNLALSMLKEDIKNKKIIIIDELGYIERNTKYDKFVQELIFKKNRNILVVVRNLRTDILEKVQEEKLIRFYRNN